jgi:AraC family transcriptional regulator of adaptative response/methylated-DNA-[protein]-cysteine methyltransferase
MRFFEGPRDAEGAGFRPCLRCRPQDAQTGAADIEGLLALLNAEETPTLAVLAQSSGLEPAYIRRLFRRTFGLSPKAYVQAQRAERLRAGLKAGTPVTEALYDAGYGSSRALYSTADALLGMTPNTYRKGGPGMTIFYTVFKSELGPCLLAATARGVCALRFGEGFPELEREFPQATLTEDAATLEPFVRAVRAHLAGEARLELPLDVSPTAFQARVWTALQAIPYGETRSYAQIAESIGAAGAVRAVAGACARNPVALAVPCHRVLRSDGSLSGYRWGVVRKKALLEREREGRLEAAVGEPNPV